MQSDPHRQGDSWCTRLLPTSYSVSTHIPHEESLLTITESLQPELEGLSQGALQASISEDHSLSLSVKDPFNCRESNEEWQLADEHLATTVTPRVLVAVSVDEKYQGLCSGVYDYFSWKYGTRSNKAHRKTKKQKCSKQEISVLRQERNKARQQLRKAKRSSSDPESLRELARKFHQYLCKYSRLSRAESRHCRKLQETRARKECGKNSGSLQLRFWMMVMATLKYSQLSMWVRQRSISQLCIAVNPDHSVSLHGFLAHQILKYLSFEEVQGIIKKVRVKSSPSPLDQIPYSVFKKCPSLTVALVNLFNTCWDLGRGGSKG